MVPRGLLRIGRAVAFVLAGAFLLGAALADELDRTNRARARDWQRIIK